MNRRSFLKYVNLSPLLFIIGCKKALLLKPVHPADISREELEKVRLALRDGKFNAKLPLSFDPNLDYSHKAVVWDWTEEKVEQAKLVLLRHMETVIPSEYRSKVCFKFDKRKEPDCHISWEYSPHYPEWTWMKNQEFINA